jgi:hypothetical protein
MAAYREESRVTVIVFQRLVESQMCPECGGPLRLYITEQGVQLLACLNGWFDVVDRQVDELVLDWVRHMAARNCREHAERKARVIKEREA